MNSGARALLGISFGLTLAAPPGAFAQDAGFYLGGSLGQSTFKEFCTAAAPTCDEKDTAWKIFGGYRFNRYVAVEGTYIDLGEL